MYQNKINQGHTGQQKPSSMYSKWANQPQFDSYAPSKVVDYCNNGANQYLSGTRDGFIPQPNGMAAAYNSQCVKRLYPS